MSNTKLSAVFPAFNCQFNNQYVLELNGFINFYCQDSKQETPFSQSSAYLFKTKRSWYIRTFIGKNEMTVELGLNISAQYDQVNATIIVQDIFQDNACKNNYKLNKDSESSEIFTVNGAKFGPPSFEKEKFNVLIIKIYDQKRRQGLF